MKSITIYISLLFFIASQGSYAQYTAYAALPPSCLTNGQFPGACVSGTNCDRWTKDCSAGWLISHGSPTMTSYTENGQTKYYIYIWHSTKGIGEGVYTPYNFQNNTSYTVKLRISAASVGGGSGIVRVYAANGLVEPTDIRCGTPIPTGIDAAEIGEFEGVTDGMDLEFIFNNNSGKDYTQLWIYPEISGGTQYNLNVFSVEACPGCNTSITYNKLMVHFGTTIKGYIYVGSSAGAGTGTITVVNPIESTNLIAGNEINLLPEFDASVTTGTFTADMFVCNSGVGTRKSTHIGNLPVAPPTNDMEIISRMAVEKTINIYPTVSKGIINILGELTVLENVELAVFDLTGRRILQIPKKSYPGKGIISLNNLNNGTYLLQIKQKENTITKKIIIQK